ncbi:Transposon Ty3-I Gag-Pol polyprotein [Araneus ventricosus]|uniref:Transposon Ty3-I Gag-Pol polyprotein n=1 Tax=Araneus ventricosus TaxID=182803 RepID=A0A4Y2SZL2_ARAVE|nr:Transposon Ty3-I Gag-Pol polyprotein [Araneus ventricosus]GBN93786.1 Transposon Ty3-I Gag-Pol polyprotein [Araneus ventricosus]
MKCMWPWFRSHDGWGWKEEKYLTVSESGIPELGLIICFFFPNQASQKVVLVAATLVLLEMEATPLIVLNLNNELKILDKLDVIATCEPVVDIVARPQEFLEHNIYRQPWRILKYLMKNSEELKEEADHLVKEMVDNGIIEESSGPWASPIVLVKKKDGSTRFCDDYRKLNEITKKDSYPLPRIDDTLDALNGSQWFTTLDLKSGYWQVEIRPED